MTIRPKRRAFHREAMRSLETFSRMTTRRPLRPYQLAAGNAIVDSVLNGGGDIFTILMARQGGKNELAAQLEAYLLQLFAVTGGSMVKAAPSFDPQLIRSRDRLGGILRSRSMPRPVRWRDGRTFQVGDASLTLLSGDPAANIVGETATLMLAIDEAQDLDEEVYTRDLRPMLATRDATTVLYGTAWHDDTILERQRRLNRDIEEATGVKLNFEADCETVSAHNPRYARFVRKEIDRLGRDSLAVRTQYFLECVPDADRLFTSELIAGLRGEHRRLSAADPDGCYVAGIDIAGTVTDPRLESRRQLSRGDETVVVIAQAERRGGRGVDKPLTRIVDIRRTKGRSFSEQIDLLSKVLWDWGITSVVVDATGMGGPIADILGDRHRNQVRPFVFTAASKSDLGYELEAALRADRVKMYADDDADAREMYRQLSRVRYRLGGGERMSYSVPASQGHDDLVTALALTIRAAEGAPRRDFPSGVIRAVPSAEEQAALRIEELLGSRGYF